MNAKEIRWKQRFLNFEKAFSRFENAVQQISELSVSMIKKLELKAHMDRVVKIIYSK